MREVKYYTLLFLLILGSVVKSSAQIDPAIQHIVKDLEALILEKPGSDSYNYVRLLPDLPGQNNIQHNFDLSDSTFLCNMHLAIKKQALNIDMAEMYILYFYKDSYSGKVFSQAKKENRGDYPQNFVSAYIPEGTGRFIKQINKDIQRNLDSTLINKYDWDKPLQFFITRRGKIDFIQNNNLVELIDSAGRFKAFPAIEYGYPMATFYQLKPVSAPNDNTNITILEHDFHQIAFPQLFHNKPLVIYKFVYPRIVSNLIVSFIWSDDQLSEPVIIKGDPTKGEELINQIQSAFDKGPDEFGFRTWAPHRFYFHVLENNVYNPAQKTN